MASEKKNENNMSVESRLKALYDLQTILTEIDRIKTIRGELPLEVKDLEDQIEGLNTRIENFTDEINDLSKAVSAERGRIENSRMLIAKYNEQMDNVRNNRTTAIWRNTSAPSRRMCVCLHHRQERRTVTRCRMQR